MKVVKTETPQSWHVNRNLSHLPKVATSYSSIFMPLQTPSLAMRLGTTTACFMLYHADDGDDSSWRCWTSIGAGSMVAVLLLNFQPEALCSP